MDAAMTDAEKTCVLRGTAGALTDDGNDASIADAQQRQVPAQSKHDAHGSGGLQGGLQGERAS